MEGGIKGAATETRPDDDVRSETVNIKLDAVLLISNDVGSVGHKMNKVANG